MTTCRGSRTWQELLNPSRDAAPGPAWVDTVGLRSRGRRGLCTQARLRGGDERRLQRQAHGAQTFLSQAGASLSLRFLLSKAYSSGLPPRVGSGFAETHNTLGTRSGFGDEDEEVDDAHAPIVWTRLGSNPRLLGAWEKRRSHPGTPASPPRLDNRRGRMVGDRSVGSGGSVRTGLTSVPATSWLDELCALFALSLS